MDLFNFLIIILTTAVVFEIVSRLIAKYLWNKLSLVKDIPLLSKQRRKDEKFSGTVIICGGSISGLLCAKVCANHFAKVIIVEAEGWVLGEKGVKDFHRDPNSPKRARVYQYDTFHAFQAIVTLVMKELFATFDQAHESVAGKLGVAFEIFHISGVPRLFSPKFPVYAGGVHPASIRMTRPTFETTTRRLLLETCKEVEMLHGTVTSLVYDETLNRVSGVNVKLPNGETTELEGNLVIDATGSFMCGHRWLKAIPKYASYRSPSLDDIKIMFDPKVSYTHAEFNLPPKLDEAFRRYGFSNGSDSTRKVIASLPANAANDKLLGIDRRDKNFLQIGCGGYNWHGSIRSPSEISDYIRELNLKQPMPEWLHDMLQTLQSEDVPATYVDSVYPHSVYIKYHELKDLPSNFVVVGDAQSQTDPIFGQGCSKACATAIILNAQLHKAYPDSDGYLPRTFAKEYFLDVKTRTEHTWENMKNIDYNYPSTIPLPGEDLVKTARFFRAYGDTLFSLITKDTDIGDLVVKQMGYLIPPINLLAPWVVRRVAWAWFKQVIGYESVI